MNISILDIILIIPLVWAIFQGLRRGFIIEIATLAALFLGIWGGIELSHYVAGFLNESMGWESTYLPTVAFGITFLGILFLVILLGKVLTKAVSIVALGIPNRLAGALFSLGKYVLILSAVIFLFEAANEKMKWISNSDKEDSFLYGPLERVIPIILPAIEEIEYQNWLERQENSIRETLDI